jgi:anti-anti-sigma factor
VAMPESLLAIITSRADSETSISLFGECDSSNIETLNKVVEEVLTFESRRIVFDAERLSFTDSSGLTPIERAVEVLRSVGGVVVVAKPSPLLRWLLDFFHVSQETVIVG